MSAFNVETLAPIGYGSDQHGLPGAKVICWVLAGRLGPEVLRQISVRGKVHKPYSAEFLQACRVSQSQMQKILTVLGEDERINRDSSGVHIVDPLERLALRVIGTREEWRSQLIESHLESA